MNNNHFSRKNATANAFEKSEVPEFRTLEPPSIDIIYDFLFNLYNEADLDPYTILISIVIINLKGYIFQK